MKFCIEVSQLCLLDRRHVCYLLATLTILIQVMNVRGAPLEGQDLEKSSRNGSRWTPPDGDMEGWLRCNGMPLKSCRNQARKMQLIRRLSSTRKSSFLALSDLTSGGESSNALATIDGCIILTEEQADSIIAQLTEDASDPDSPTDPEQSGVDFEPVQQPEDKPGDAQEPPKLSRKKRGGLINFMRFPTQKWPLPIQYKFDGNHDSSQLQTIRNGFQHWMDNTCVRFAELSPTTFIPDNHILITNDNSKEEKCYSNVGRASYRPQQLNLAPNCFNQFGVTVHEIGHALGLWHEHTRPDRDSFIRVLTENMVLGYQSQYNKNNDIDTRGQPYDFGSVMHYSSSQASWNGQPTLSAKDPLYQQNMGQRTGLSYGDIKIINLAYCQDSCKRPLSRSCEKGGYQNPNNCDVCICPTGFSGSFCEQLAPSKNAACGGEFQVNQREDLVIKSPGYDIPEYYNSYQECSWLIKAPVGQRLRMDFLGLFAILYQDGTCVHWVEVKYKKNMEYEGARFCGYSRPVSTLWSEGNELLVIFKSNYSGAEFYPNAQRGFQAHIQLESTNIQLPSGAAGVETTTTTPKPTTTPTTTPRVEHELPGNDCQSLDLAFLVDTSNDMLLTDQRRITIFIQNIVTQLQRGGTDLRVALARYTVTATSVVGINDRFETEGLFVVQSLAWRLLQHDTNTASGLNLIRTQILADARYRNNPGTGGAAMYVPRVCVLITNGGSTVDRDRALAEAESARRAGIKFIVVAVGPSVNGTEASRICGSDSGVIYTKDFADFDQTSNTPDIVKLTTDKVCDNNQYGTAPRTLWECSFEPGQGSGQLCGMIQDRSDQFDWTLQTGKTPSDHTGPSSAYDKLYYIFIEATDQRFNDEARISVPRTSTYTGPACIDFYYHMYGFHINTLKLVQITSQYTRILWMRYKDMGNSWNHAYVDVTVQSDIQLQFIASRGQEYSGDIALDNIRLTSGICSRSV